MKKRKTIFILVIISLVILVVPFFFKHVQGDPIPLFSLAFTILQTLATVATLGIALLLYDKFGLDSKLVEKQINKVFELIDLLKQIAFVVEGKNCQYFIRASRHHIKLIEGMAEYKIDCEKEILVVVEDYTSLVKDILLLRTNHWLPSDIKEKLEFINIYATIDANDISKDKFVKLHSRLLNKDIQDWSRTLPVITFNELNQNLYSLVDTIDIWVKQHTAVSIDFFNENITR